MSSYELWVGTDGGLRTRLLADLASFEYVRTVNQVGRFSVRMPLDFGLDYLKRDNVVEIWRVFEGGSISLDFVGMARRWRITERDVTVSGPDMLDLLRRRIVDYAAGTSQASKSDQADDMIKAIVRENLGSSAIAARDLTSAGLSVDPDAGAGASIVKSFAWRNALAVCQEIAEASRQAGTPVYFDIVPSVGTSGLSYLFQTYTTRRGADRTGTTLVGYDIGNVDSPSLEYNYDDEVNWARAGGQGEESDRMTATGEDTTRSGASLWGRAEVFQDARQLGTSAALADLADKRVSEGRPRLTYQGILRETPSTRYGRDWGFGDELAVNDFGLQFAAMIRSVRVSMDQEGKETIDAKLEANL